MSYNSTYRSPSLLHLCNESPASSTHIISFIGRQYVRSVQNVDILPPFHSTCPGEFFLRVLIRCLFSHFSVRSSILCTSWQGRRILFWSLFAVVKCLLIHRWKQYNRLPLFLLKFEPACLQHLRQYRTHMKHDNYGLYVITSKASFPLANFELTKVCWSTVHHVMTPVSFLFTLPSGTTVPVGTWSSGSMCVHYVRKTGGCCVFLL